MPELLPLFPLGTVLLPGAGLPLHVFEDRYRVLVSELLSRPEEERLFGVVAIRQGREVGEDGVAALHEVGTVARVLRAVPHDDGRWDVLTVGTRRFRLDGLQRGRPYAQGLVTWLDEASGGATAALQARVGGALADYVAALEAATGRELDQGRLPDDAVELSYTVAGSMLLDEHERQALLAADDAATRLRTELRLLGREVGLLRALSCAPAPDLLRSPVDLN